jgi:hypothetical protein
VSVIRKKIIEINPGQAASYIKRIIVFTGMEDSILYCYFDNYKRFPE